MPMKEWLASRMRASRQRAKASFFISLYGSGSQPVAPFPVGVEQPFQRGHLRPLENTDIYIMIHNSSKISYEAATK